MAYCYRQDGEYEDAIKHYKRALHIDPELMEAREYLGQAYIRLAVASMKQTEKYMKLASKEWRQLREGKAVAHADKLETSIRKADDLRRRGCKTCRPLCCSCCLPHCSWPAVRRPPGCRRL